MSVQVALRRRLPRVSWPAPRELFGESLPEVLLVAAVVAAVVSAVFALNGTG